MQQIGVEASGIPEQSLGVRSRLQVGPAAKRAFDVIFALSCLILAAPIWLIAALLIRRSSPGPVIFRQTRPGKDGRPFTMYKFRTMVDRAEDLLRRDAQLAAQFEQGWKLQSDPRITPVGRWLRKSSIDELPQLLNVLRGEMSVVGPRPPLLEEVERWGPREWGRMAVKPGLTCLWQVSGRSAASYEERIALDLEYIQNRSFWYDLKIVVRTIPSVLLGSGAV